MIWRDLKAPEVVDKVSQSGDHLQLMHDAGYNSAAVVPLVARGRTLGALSFLHAHGDLRYDAGDLEFLAELGERAALALDNARLYRERDRIAKNLQRGLRPPRPARGAGAGDLGRLRGGRRGDRGRRRPLRRAAERGRLLDAGRRRRRQGQRRGRRSRSRVRHSVRGLTREIDEPDEVLRRVNELLLDGDSLNDFATAMLVRLRREGQAAGGSTLASAGHPPAVLASERRADAARRRLGARRLAESRSRAARADAGPGRDARPLHRRLARGGAGGLPPGTRDLRRDDPGRCPGWSCEELTERLRADAVGRSSGTLRDDLVVLAVRPGPPRTSPRPLGSRRPARLAA